MILPFTFLVPLNYFCAQYVCRYLLGAAVVVHVIEATLAGHCALELKLPRHIALGWAGLTFLGGNGTLRLLHEIRAQRGSGNKPNDKSH